MTWREDLRRVVINGREFIGASFRGVPFFVESSERTGGRRVVSHEFPFRDDPYVEDLGRKARGWRIDGYVIGGDYLAQRDALLDALEAEGVGELVHPYEGIKRCICADHTVGQRKAEGGMASFSLAFVEAPTQQATPTIIVDSAQQVATSADAAIAATSAELVEQYDVDGLPAFSLESAQNALTRVAAALDAGLSPIVTGTQELAELTGRIALLTTKAASLVRQPADVLGEVRDVIVGLVDTIKAVPFAVVNALIEAYFADLGTAVDPITATRARELANQQAITAGLRRVIAVEAARLAPLVPYTSIDEATATRDEVAALLEEQASLAGDTAYPAIVDLRSQVLRAVPGGSAFARVVTVTRNVPVPSVMLAYQLYGNVDSELDIVARNGVRHPGFVVGDLKVLSDG